MCFIFFSLLFLNSCFVCAMESHDRALSLHQKGVHEQDNFSWVPFLGLPKDVMHYTVTRMLDGDRESTDIFNAYLKKEGIGKALLCYGLVHESKGIAGLSRAQSVALLCSSTETYVLCKRLIPEFLQQKKDNEKVQGDSQKRASLYAQNKEIWKETQDIRVSNHELALLCTLPPAVKQQIEHNCVMPQLSLLDMTGVSVGSLVIVPTVFTVMFGLTVAQRLTDCIYGGSNGRNKQLIRFDEVFNVPYSFVKDVMKSKNFYFYDPMKIKNAFKGLRSDSEEDPAE